MYCSSIQSDGNLVVLSTCYLHRIFLCEPFRPPYHGLMSGCFIQGEKKMCSHFCLVCRRELMVVRSQGSQICSNTIAACCLQYLCICFLHSSFLLPPSDQKSACPYGYCLFFFCWEEEDQILFQVLELFFLCFQPLTGSTKLTLKKQFWGPKVGSEVYFGHPSKWGIIMTDYFHVGQGLLCADTRYQLSGLPAC